MLHLPGKSGENPPPEHVRISSVWCVQGVRETARSILAQDGIRGLYRGFGTVMLGAVPARVVSILPCNLTGRSERAHIDSAGFHMPFQASTAAQPRCMDPLLTLWSPKHVCWLCCS